jgi:tetratricopeptide (TPR) repeat protein
MNLVKYAVAILWLFITVSATAQKSNIQTAKISLRNGDLKEAKKYIDLAAANEETKNSPAMWFTKGDVYFAIAIDTTPVGVMLQQLEKEASYVSLDAYINSVKTGDEKNAKNAMIQIAGEAGKILGIAPVVFNEAQLAMQNQSLGKDPNGYAKAIRYLDLILSAFPYDKANKIKSANSELTENMVTKSAGKAAFYAKNWPLVNKYFGKLAADNFNDADVYWFLAKAYEEQGDTTNALKYVSQGRELRPDNQDLIDEELNLYYLTGQADKFVEKLSKAIESDPGNAKYYYYRGNTYDVLFDKNPAKTEYVEKAEADYRKALEIEPNDADLNAALARLYFNKAVPVINQREETDNVKNKKKFDELDAKAKELLKECIKYYEAASAARPDDTYILDNLKRAYAQIGNMEKVNELGKKIKELEAGGK